MIEDAFYEARAKRAALREVLHALVREKGGAMGKVAFLKEAEERTKADPKEIYSALRSSEELYFNRKWVGFARSSKELMEKLGYKQVVDKVIEGPDMMTTLFVHYEKV